MKSMCINVYFNSDKEDKFYALKNIAHVIASYTCPILHIFAICGNSQGSKWPN